MPAFNPSTTNRLIGSGGGYGGGPGVPPMGEAPLVGGGGGTQPLSSLTGGMPGPSGTSTTLDFPEYGGYDPFAGNPELQENIDVLSEAGRGLMDPNSDYYKRLSAAMQRQIGGQSQAQQRSAALRGAWGGLGGGGGGEVMRTAADIGQAGLEAQGMAEGELALRAPGMGAGMLTSTFNPMLGMSQLQEGSSQFGASLGEGARQYGGNMGLTMAQMAQQNEQFGAGLAQDAEMANLDAYLRELAMQYGQF